MHNIHTLVCDFCETGSPGKNGFLWRIFFRVKIFYLFIYFSFFNRTVYKRQDVLGNYYVHVFYIEIFGTDNQGRTVFGTIRLRLLILLSLLGV